MTGLLGDRTTGDAWVSHTRMWKSALDGRGQAARDARRRLAHNESAGVARLTEKRGLLSWKKPKSGAGVALRW